jgi:hypothetical protein
VKLRVFFDSWLLVDCLQSSHSAETFIEVDVRLAVGKTDYYLVDGWTPAKTVD